MTTTNGNPIERIANKITSYREALRTPSISAAEHELPECRDEIRHLKVVMTQIDSELKEVPSIEVAFLGPSRHGKSTLLNALAECSILQTSDIKPCTAAIVSLRWEPEWQMRLTFVTPRELKKEKNQAVQDAAEFVERLRHQDLQDEMPDDPRYLKSVLQRFLTLYDINADESPERLVESVRAANLPENIERLLGQHAEPKSTDLANMQGLVRKYLSTEDVYWTIVDRCEIAGPFENWHRKLHVIDLPGTNDTDPYRTSITNSLREKARAVAICTSDSNLGPDIESWLQNSSVLGDFLEAPEGRRQRLFILRTKFDAFHPKISDDLIDEDDDESEDRLIRDAIEVHKQEQTDAFRDMIRDIAAPKIPFGESEAVQRKREEMISHLNNIPVFFVSALAHEVFEGRYKVGRKTKRNLSEHFDDGAAATGIPAVRQYLNHVAEEFLTQNYYDDLERQLDKEVDLLVRFFRRQGKMLGAGLSGTTEVFGGLISSVESTVIPWVKQEVKDQVESFRRDASVAAKEIENRLDYASAMSRRRMKDKADKWMHVAWNSLKATGRKGGAHTTCRGLHIDITQDICSVLVDDLLLAWSSYRDFLIRERVTTTTGRLTATLVERLQEAATRLDIGGAQDVVKEVVDGLVAISQAQCDDLVRKVDLKVKQIESIRHPAYELVKKIMEPTYISVSHQSGPGCQCRMQDHLMRGMEENIDRINAQIQEMVSCATNELMDHCSQSLVDFGHSASHRIETALNELREVSRVTETERAQRRLSIVQQAAAALPAPSA